LNNRTRLAKNISGIQLAKKSIGFEKSSAEGNLLKKLHNTRVSSSSNYRTGHHKVGNARFKK